MGQLGVSILFTVSALCAVVALSAAWWATQRARDVDHTEKRLTQLRARVLATEKLADALDDSLRRCWGTVSRLKRDRPRDIDATQFLLGASEEQEQQLQLGGMGGMNEMDPDLAAEIALTKGPRPNGGA